jgi:hypothetical protein
VLRPVAEAGVFGEVEVDPTADSSSELSERVRKIRVDDRLLLADDGESWYFPVVDAKGESEKCFSVDGERRRVIGSTEDDDRRLHADGDDDRRRCVSVGDE